MSEVAHRCGGKPLLQWMQRERTPTRKAGTEAMLTAIIVTIIIMFALGWGFRGDRNGVTIRRRPYNNRYNDAAGARDDAVLEGE
jgi:hypothetical protein